MENPTSFELNDAVHRWREALASSPAFSRENLDELEAHLRDSILSLEGRGLSAAEAFWVARQRLGTGEEISAEFSKVNAERIWLDRAVWIVAGSLAIGAVSTFTLALNSLFTSAGSALSLEGHTLGLVSVLIHGALFFLVLFWCWRSAVRGTGILPRIAVWARAHPMLAAAAAALLLIALHAAQAGAQVLSVKVMGITSLGLVSLWRMGCGALMGVVLWPAVLACLLLRRRRQRSLCTGKTLSLGK